MQAEPFPTITQQMVSTTAIEMKQTPLLNPSREPSPINALDLTMRTETHQAHALNQTMQREPASRHAQHSTVREAHLYPGLLTLQTELSPAQVYTPRPALLKETPHVYTLGPAIQTETPQAYAPDRSMHTETLQPLDPVMQPETPYTLGLTMPTESPLAHAQQSTMSTKPSSAQVSYIPSISSTDQFSPVHKIDPTLQQVPFPNLQPPAHSIPGSLPSIPRASTTILQASHPHSANAHIPVPMGYTMPPWFGSTNLQITSPLPPGPEHSIPPTPPHNYLIQQSGYVPATAGKPPQRQLSVNMPRPQRATAEKVKLRVLSHCNVPSKINSGLSWGQKLDFLLHTDDNLTVMHYYQFKGRSMSGVSKKPIPLGHRYDCRKFITQQYIILQSQPNQLSFYNHDLQLIKTLSCPGWVKYIIGELYAVVRSITAREGLPVVTIYIRSLTNLQEIHHKLESPKAYDVDAALAACGWLDGRVAITQNEEQYADFYSITGHHIQRVDLDGTTGCPGCTAQHVLVPLVQKPQTRMEVFTWAGKLVKHLELGLDFYNQCSSISPVHEGKLNVVVHNVSEKTNKVITCEIQECEEEDDEAMNMDMDESGQ